MNEDFLAGFAFAARLAQTYDSGVLTEGMNDPHLQLGDDWDMGFALGCASAFGR